MNHAQLLMSHDHVTVNLVMTVSSAALLAWHKKGYQAFGVLQ